DPHAQKLAAATEPVSVEHLRYFDCDQAFEFQIDDARLHLERVVIWEVAQAGFGAADAIVAAVDSPEHVRPPANTGVVTQEVVIGVATLLAKLACDLVAEVDDKRRRFIREKDRPELAVAEPAERGEPAQHDQHGDRA